MSDAQNQAQSLLNSALSKVKSRVKGDGTLIPKSKYAGSSTGTMYGENVDTKGNKPPVLEQVGTKTKKMVSAN